MKYGTVRGKGRALGNVALIGMLVGVCIGLWAAVSPVSAAQVTLAWDPSAESDVAGYRLYCGYAPENYQFSLDVGLQTQCTVSNLQEGRMYFLALTAYDAAGNESGFSNEVTYQPIRVSDGDFDADGVPDVLWRDASGRSVIWFLQTEGSSIRSAIYVPIFCESGWEVAGIGDFNQDGIPDILWRNVTEGLNVIWYMGSNGTALQGAVMIPRCARNWSVGGVADFDGDGQPDILWRDQVTGSDAIWYLDVGGSDVREVVGAPRCDPAWVVAGLGDFDGDFTPDIAWRNTVTGSNAVWYLNSGGRTVKGGAAVPHCALAWQIGKIADFDGDTVPDIFWRNANGHNAIWYMEPGGVSVREFIETPACGVGWEVWG